MNAVTQERTWLTRGVLSIGLASLFSDVGHEMATAVLPAFLTTLTVGSAAAALGMIEGLADFVSSIARLYAGYAGGRMHHMKWAASGGYVVTALAKGAIALAVVWPHVLIARTVGWLGRGYRTPLRDTLMAEQVDPRQFGKAYGLERAMDSIGAVLGPLCALVLLSLAVELRTIFWLTLIPGVLAAGMILTGVRERRAPAAAERASAHYLPPVFKRFLVAVGLFGLGDFSRILLILWATGEELRFTDTSSAGPAMLAIGLYVLYNLVAAISSYVSGHRSDDVGRKPILLFGYAAATAVSAVMLLDVRSVPIMALVFVGSGVYMGIQEALERALAADLLPASSRSFGFGMLATVNGLGDLVSSLTVGLLWMYAGPAAAFGFSAAMLLLGTVALAALVPAETK